MAVDGRLVGFGGELDKEVAGVHGEEGGEEGGVGDFVAVDGVAVAAGAGVDADIAAFGGGEAGEDSGGRGGSEVEADLEGCRSGVAVMRKFRKE